MVDADVVRIPPLQPDQVELLVSSDPLYSRPELDRRVPVVYTPA